ncbi:MAG: transporter substrate-binding domain-containing protein [Bacteroides sp.]|nr:transporter substrate-binding domain-containing protein [Barnesiella sp.]MBD5256410.1 transporter substrate-binding domain-containing protein [Bacteroides sp.]
MIDVFTKKSRSQSSFMIGLLFFVIILMVLLRTCSFSFPGSDKKRSGGDTIDIAIEYGPLSLYRYDDTLGGFAYDILRHIEEQEGMRFKFHPVMTLKEALKGIDKGYYRMVVTAMPINADLRKRYSTTLPVFLDRQVLVQMKSDQDSDFVRSQLDLAGKRVYVMAGSPVAERLHNLASEIGDTIYVFEDPLYGSEQLFILAATGEIPRAVVTERTAKSLIDYYPEADISTAVSFTQFQRWLLSPEDSILCNRFDSIINVYKDKPFYKRLEKRYFN